MEEEVGVKVTRLRRRLSVEADDVKSPSTQSTPNKKRGGRLAAKPQLELINENATDIEKPKRTRKSIARDAEPEEKIVTPSRRSTRIKSNTSIVSETPLEVEEKGTPLKRSTRIRSNTSIVSETPLEIEEKGTPARRSTRIKSNTSIVAETAQHVDSPRAKRAARRTSQVGSDNETTATPSRTTRRTRKDSTSSIDKQADFNLDKVGPQVNEIIIEETDSNGKDSTTNQTPSKDTSITLTTRKSPRIVEKTSKNSPEHKNTSENLSKLENGKQPKDENSITANTSIGSVKEANIDKKHNISVNSSNLINQLDDFPRKDHASLNKTTSAVEEAQLKAKRRRTKSWTTTTLNSSNDNNFLSDTEATRNKLKRNKNKDGSVENVFNTSGRSTGKSEELVNVSLNSSTLSNKKNKKLKDKSLLDLGTKVPSVNKLDSFTDNKDLSPQTEEANFTEKFFRDAPKGAIQSLVYIEDSDSNTGTAERDTELKENESGDQCVPVVEQQLENQSSKEVDIDRSYEPMDIDETIPANVSLVVSSVNNTSTVGNTLQSTKTELEDNNIPPNKSKRKSKIDTEENDVKVDDNSFTKSKRKSSNSETSCVNDNNFINISTVTNNTKEGNKSNRKLSNSYGDSDANISLSKNNSKRKSSISKTHSNDDEEEDDTTNSKNKSISISDLNKSKDSNIKNESTLNNDENKKRKSFLAQNNDNDTFAKESSVTTANDELDSGFNKSNSNDNKGNLSSNKSKRRSANALDSGVNNSCSDSKKESSISDAFNKYDNKSVKKTSISKIDADDSVDSALNPNTPKRKSSLSDMESQVFDKSNSENKSTLVLSQLKDLSESNAAKPFIELNKSKDQLSKSVNMSNINKDKECNKLNISLTYSTSTPIQEKSLRKLGMQMNSSIITPNNVAKKKKNSSLDRSKNKTPVFSKDDTTEPSDEEDENTSEDENEESSNDESANKSNLIDNEADEASEDYESGDSRDEDEREYEEQHEIVEKGETLDSEDENFSDDSDYEKGSFVVDSDEEDAELLSGSGDDLSMSADELSMSAKSKNKYNERKTKEQKKASREMFEARHQMNKSNSIRKINRQRLESSQSEEEVNPKTRKVKRARIDSSQDITINQSDADTTELKQKRKASRRLSDSVCEENPTDENEISIHDNNETIKDDPLSLSKIVKKEPKTPQKDLHISTVRISNNAVEEVDIENNVTLMDTNLTRDPLQVTSAEEELMEDASEGSISENEEITQNYESMLNDLNKKKNKVKSLNMSLNLNKNTKQKDRDSIMDELNLTQPKKLKKKKKELKDSDQIKLQSDIPTKIKEKHNKSLNNHDEGSSDSIDMKLLFNDDSTDNETKPSIQKVNSTTVEEFIPLKRTEGKTNILEKRDSISEGPNEFCLNVSKSKKGKRKSIQPEEVVENEDDGDLNFFIDTTGTHEGIDKEVDTSINKSGKNNKKKTNVSVTNIDKEINDDDTNDAPLEISYQSEKNKSKQVLNVSQDVEQVVNSVSGTPLSAKKKKNKKSLDKSQINEVIDYTTKEVSLEVSFGSKNKLKQLLDLSNTEEKEIETETPVSAKKNKKNKKNLDRSQIIEATDNTNNDIPLELSFQSDKNKSKQDLDVDTENRDNIAPGSNKKNKKKKSLNNSQITEVTELETQADKAQDVSIGKTRKHKATEDTESALLEKETNKEEVQPVLITEEGTSKKRKRKLSLNQSREEKTEKEAENLGGSKLLNESSVPTNQTKKRKISHTIDSKGDEYKGPDNEEQENRADSKPKKKSKTVAESRLVQNNYDSTKKIKKRKERDDDDSEKVSKVLKQNSLDKVHVPRLPAEVLRQLDECTRGNKSKDKIISTTSFKVEETRKRRTKPSHYLEESVYLNDSTEEPSKNRNVKAPKVLPFIPTASTSGYGFTTTFKVNVIPQETQFVAQTSNVYNFKQDCLQKNRIKKLGTFEKYKRHRNVKISKF